MSADTSAARLDFLLVSTDRSTPEAAQAALKTMARSLQCVDSVAAGREFVRTQKIDSVVIDLEIKTALKFIAEIRKGKNARAFAFVCVSNDAESAVALRGGANALLTRPLSVEAMAATIGSFRSIIASEHRRYFRHAVTIPAVITLGEHSYQGIVENISQGGLAIRLPCLLPEASIVDFSFDLETGAIEGSAQLKWENTESLAGMAFRKLVPKSKQQLMTWLDDLSQRDDAVKQN